jgi:hypothetical protein
MSAAHATIHFRDRRAPHEIQFELEKRLKILFRPLGEAGWRATPKVNGCPYALELSFDAALPSENCYTLRIDADWSRFGPEHHDYFRKSFDSWIRFWTGPYRQETEPRDPGSRERYAALAEQSRNVEAHLRGLEDVQREILSRMRNGAYYATSHKEGGTNIRWQGSAFVRADYGESNDRVTFLDDASFLRFLRQFYDRETGSAIYPEMPSDFDAWKLMLRFLS